MNTLTIPHKEKNKHLNSTQIEYILNQIKEFEKTHKDKKRNISKTDFLKHLAEEVGTSLSNIYRIRSLGTVTVVSSSLKPYQDYSPMAVINKFNSGRKRPNNLKLHKAEGFIKRVVNIVKKKQSDSDEKYDLTSIDEAVHALLMDYPDLYPPEKRVCTKSIYNYVNRRMIDLKPIDLPRMSGLKRSGHVNKDKLPLSKRQKGISIDFRPDVSDRADFGHWEGDLVTGPRDGKRGAYLTLLERKTREYIMLPIESKSAQNVLDCIEAIAKYFGSYFSQVFKSVTFDNGNEFTMWREMEADPNTGEKRTSVFFAHPYCSFERGSNENCNGLIRRFIKKGTDINKIDRNVGIMINKAINRKRRKINGYLSSQKLFENELQKLGVPKSKANFYGLI